MDVYFELAQGSSMRLCRKLEEHFPVLRGWQLELLRYLCLIAYESEIYDGVCEGAWLRTTIELEGASNSVFAASSPEHNLLAGIAAESRVAYWRMLHERQSDLTARIRIHSNILPLDAYLAPAEIQHQSWLRGSCVSKRRFYPSEVLAEAVEENSTLTEKVQEYWSRNGGTCVLGRHLRRSPAPHAQLRNRLRDVESADVKLTTEKLGEGAEGSVYKVSWRNGTYASKLFDQETYEKECEVALRVLHPHVVHPFGRTSDVEGNPKCLLMEMLSEDLSRFAVERNRSHGACPLFSPLDALDVLQQLASAMEFLHSRNVVHGDLKPSNILISHFEISESSRHILAKITDFGNAQFIVPGEDFTPGGPGTTRYAAPELLGWRRNYADHVQFPCPKKLDVYSFGVVAFEVLTGHAAYNGPLSVPDVTRVISGSLKPSDSLKKIWSSMRRRYPIELIGCLETCWELEPSERPSFGEVCDVLQRSRLKVQLLERKAVDLRNFLAVCFAAFVIVFVASWLQRFTSGLLLHW